MRTKNLIIENEPAGFMAVPRYILDAIFSKKRTVKDDVRVMFYFMVFKALWADNEKLGLKRGDMVFTVKGLAAECGHSERYMSDFIKKLVEHKEVSIEKRGKVSVMHFINYDELCMGGQPKKKQSGKKAATAPVFDDMKNFEIFWENYHENLKEVGREDKNLACIEWHKLDIESRKLAYMNVEQYVESLRDVRFAKKAVNYLKDRCFIF